MVSDKLLSTGNAHSRGATAQDVIAIRRLRESNPAKWSYRRLAAKFGFSGPTIHDMVVRKTWRNI